MTWRSLGGVGGVKVGWRQKRRSLSGVNQPVSEFKWGIRIQAPRCYYYSAAAFAVAVATQLQVAISKVNTSAPSTAPWTLWLRRAGICGPCPPSAFSISSRLLKIYEGAFLSSIFEWAQKRECSFEYPIEECL